MTYEFTWSPGTVSIPKSDFFVTVMMHVDDIWRTEGWRKIRIAPTLIILPYFVTTSRSILPLSSPEKSK